MDKSGVGVGHSHGNLDIIVMMLEFKFERKWVEFELPIMVHANRRSLILDISAHFLPSIALIVLSID